jgi:hypothetical protein
MGLYGWWILQDVLRLKDFKRELDALLQKTVVLLYLIFANKQGLILILALFHLFRCRGALTKEEIASVLELTVIKSNTGQAILLIVHCL